MGLPLVVESIDVGLLAVKEKVEGLVISGENLAVDTVALVVVENGVLVAELVAAVVLREVVLDVIVSKLVVVIGAVAVLKEDVGVFGGVLEV